MADWYYARGGDRQGPISQDELRALAARGELQPDDLVWRDGMAQWAQAAERPELFPRAAAPGAPSPAVVSPMAQVMPQTFPQAATGRSVGTMGYYVPHAGLPPRASANLHGHAHPRGDVSDWPLDDGRVAAFQETMKLRKKVMAAAGLYRLICLVLSIFAAAYVVVAMTTPARGGPEMASMLIGLLVIAAIAALFAFAWRGTARSQQWAPLTMFILFLLGTALSLLGAALTLGGATGRMDGATAVGTVIGVLFWGAFAGVSWQGFAAIPRYRAQPAWCQELIAASKI